jgi:chemotaxis protein CheZ
MPAQRKIFRIEESLQIDAGASLPALMGEDPAELRHHELMSQLSALRELLDRNAPSRRQGGESGLDTIAQGRELKRELDAIHEAIRRTKQEIGGLEAGVFIGPQMARVGRELDAVIAGTEQATQNILKSAEDIDQNANTLCSLLKDGYAQGLTQDIRDLVVKIFEACNFQDLTGQRIGKVVATLKFIEDHINRMQEIWRSIEHVASATPPTLPRVNSDRKFLNGPKLPNDVGHSSQAEIDLIFDTN